MCSSGKPPPGRPGLSREPGNRKRERGSAKLPGPRQAWLGQRESELGGSGADC